MILMLLQDGDVAFGADDDDDDGYDDDGDDYEDRDAAAESDGS